MKLFISYKFTGEKIEDLELALKNICSSLEKAGHVCFCSLWHEEHFQKNNFTHKQILDYALKELDQADTCLAYIKSSEKSEGMLIETGYAMAKNKKIYIAINKEVKSVFMREIADELIEFENLEELCLKLENLK